MLPLTMGPMQSIESRIPKLFLPGRVVSRQLSVEHGQLGAVYVYEGGLVVTFFVDADRVRFEANRSWTVDEDGVVVFAGLGRPS